MLIDTIEQLRPPNKPLWDRDATVNLLRDVPGVRSSNLNVIGITLVEKMQELLLFDTPYALAQQSAKEAIRNTSI